MRSNLYVQSTDESSSDADVVVDQSDADETASPSQHEQDLLSRLSPDVVCQLIDSVFSELVSEFKVHNRTHTRTLFDPLRNDTLKPHHNRPLYSNTVIRTLAVDG